MKLNNQNRGMQSCKGEHRRVLTVVTEAESSAPTLEMEVEMERSEIA